MKINVKYKERLTRRALAQKLPPNVLSFVKNYCLTGDTRRAAIRAGYPPLKAKKIGDKLLTYSVVKRLIDKFMSLNLDKLELSKDSIIKRLATVANARVDDYLIWDKFGNSTLVDKSKLTAEQLYAVDSIEKTKDGFKLKLMDRMKALEFISKFEGSFNKGEITVREQCAEDGLVEPPLEALTLEELEVYKQLVKKMLDYRKSRLKIDVTEEDIL